MQMDTCLFFPQHPVAGGKPGGIPITETFEITKKQIVFLMLYQHLLKKQCTQQDVSVKSLESHSYVLFIFMKMREKDYFLFFFKLLLSTETDTCK